MPLNKDMVGIHSPEISKNSGPWFNSAELELKELQEKKKVVMIDFWTYSCVNCLRTLPFIKKWHDKYGEKGLVIIGVHTPEFEFEKDPGNVEAFLKKEGIRYPVVMDNDYKIWNAFTNRYWPRKFIIDTKGTIRYDHAGEGAYEETEKVIQKLLNETSGIELSQLEEEHHHITQGAVCYPMTPELYGGYKRGLIGNQEGFVQEKSHDYKAEKVENYVDGRINLEGKWLSKPEYVQHDGEVGNDFLAILYHGLEVNAVFKSASTSGYKVLVERDGQPMEKSFAGEDVHFDEKGKSFVEVTEPKLYNLIKDKEPGKHILKMQPTDNNFQLFAFTFGGCVD